MVCSFEVKRGRLAVLLWCMCWKCGYDVFTKVFEVLQLMYCKPIDRCEHWYQVADTASGAHSQQSNVQCFAAGVQLYFIAFLFSVAHAYWRTHIAFTTIYRIPEGSFSIVCDIYWMMSLMLCRGECKSEHKTLHEIVDEGCTSLITVKYSFSSCKLKCCRKMICHQTFGLVYLFAARRWDCLALLTVFYCNVLHHLMLTVFATQRYWSVSMISMSFIASGAVARYLLATGDLFCIVLPWWITAILSTYLHWRLCSRLICWKKAQNLYNGSDTTWILLVYAWFCSYCGYMRRYVNDMPSTRSRATHSLCTYLLHAIFAAA